MKMELYTDKEGRNWAKIVPDKEPQSEPDYSEGVEPDEDIFEEHESEADWARGEGFWIDEDGHWHPLDDEDDL